MEQQRDNSVTLQADDTDQHCGVCACAADRKSPCGHVVRPPYSQELEVDLSLCRLTSNIRDDDVSSDQPISVRCGI